MTVSLSGTLSDELQGGAYVDLTVKLGLVKLLHKTLDLCQEAENSCPIAPGPVVFTETGNLGAVTPRVRQHGPE